MAFAVGVGVGREAEEIIAEGIQAGVGRIQTGERRTIVAVSLVTELSADGRADGVSAPDREHVARGAHIAAAEFGDAVADEFRAEGGGHTVGISEIAGGRQRPVLHRKGAGEGIEGARRISLVDGLDQLRLPARSGFIFDYPTDRVEERGFPGPRTAQLAAQTGEPPVNGGVNEVGAGREIGETFVRDRNRRGRAREAGGAVGIGGAGRRPEAGAERIVGIRRGHDDETVRALRDAIGFPVGDGLRLIEAGVGKGGDAVVEVEFTTRENIGAVGLRLNHAIVIVVPIVGLRDPGAAWGGGGEGGSAGTVGHEEERTAGRRERRGHTGRTRAGKGRNLAKRIRARHAAEQVVAELGRGGAKIESRVGRDVPRCGRAVTEVGLGGEGAVAGVHRLAAVEVGGDHRAALAFGEVETVGERGAVFTAVAVAGLAVAQREFGAPEIFGGDVIHDARDGIGAVDGRRAVAEDFHALETAVGQGVHVGRERGDAGLVLADRVRHEPATVEQK